MPGDDAGTAPAPPPPPIGSGPTIVAAILDALRSSAGVESFEGRFDFGPSQIGPDAGTPWAELVEVASDTSRFSGRRFVEAVVYRLTVRGEEPLDTRREGEAARDALDLAVADPSRLTFDDGVLREFRRLGNPLMRDPAVRARGPERLFSYALTYRAVVARVLTTA